MENVMLNCYKLLLTLAITLTVVSGLFPAKNPVRIKDIANIQGVRDNQLMGFGLVTGLQGKGDTQSFKLTQKMLLNLSSNYGFDIKETDIKSKNIAAVMVIANIGGFARRGDNVNVTITSIGDAKSLAGGVLLQTALKAADGNIYAVAQGRMIAGTKEQNSETSASIPEGAIVERDVVSVFTDGSKINIILKNPDFATAIAIKEAVSGINSGLAVNALDAGLVEVTLGEEEKKNPVDFISKLEVLTVTPDSVAMVIIDKKSGIVVSGGDVIIQECSVNIPSAQVNVKTTNSKRSYQIVNQTVGDLVKLLNDSGLETNEVIAMLEAIHRIGAINARLILL
jgi:flagellar P-ring protein precursor FlgI